jgi:hypothetical protein
LRRTAVYRHDDEVLPMADSIGPAGSSGTRDTPPPNVLLDEYWDVHRALVR